MKIIAWDGGTRYLVLEEDREIERDTMARVLDLNRKVLSFPINIHSITAHSPDWHEIDLPQNLQETLFAGVEHLPAEPPLV